MTQILRTIEQVKTALKQHRNNNQTIGFVPTMGALHAGHGSLIEASKSQCDITIVSIFVNLKQFAAGEDFDTYPRIPETDIAFLKTYHVDYVFLPTDEQIYPSNFSTHITMSGPADGLESISRPHFFHGVATVVTKLLLITLPDIAFFGEKDYQQLSVIKRLTTDLSIPVMIMGIETKRESDGLAMSSRNRYLNDAQRKIAVKLYESLCLVKDLITKNPNYDIACQTAKGFLLENGFNKIDYIEVRCGETLSPVITSGHIRILGAAFLGTTRLIDNIKTEFS